MFTTREWKSCLSLIAGLALGIQMISPTLAQEPAPSAAGPIDIQADEQEFADDYVIASGKVKVVYGDTIIHAPKATLYRDAAGQPKQAIFVGKPVLHQGNNIIIANKLTFNINEALIVAEGNAHSEVLTAGMGADGSPAPAKEEEAGSEEGNESKKEEKADKGNDKPQKIITDSDKQIYEKTTGKFEAIGHVHVTTGEITVDSNNLKLVYGTDARPEAVLFTGNVEARRDKNVTQADAMTYFLTTQRLQATGHVRSRVVQEKVKAEAGQDTSKPKTASSGGGVKVLDFDSDGGGEILIISDAQDYNKGSGRMDAEGNVQIYYKDTVGKGPKVAMLANEFGQTEKVIFMGRSQITQTGRRWIADRITLMMEDRRVIAEGNTRAIIVKQPLKKPPALLSSPAADSNSRLAGKGVIQ